MDLLAGSAERISAKPFDEANGPISKCVQCVCHDTLPWLISVSLGFSTPPMQLKDFITETFKEIVDGVIAAQEYSGPKGARISPSGLTSRTDQGQMLWDRATAEIATLSRKSSGRLSEVPSRANIVTPRSAMT